ncbi:MAG: hypothetical protein ACREFB_08965 [Stellaceae bacterium]
MVEHDKIIAEPVHLAKRNAIHAAAYMAGRAVLSNAAGAILAVPSRRPDPVMPRRGVPDDAMCHSVACDRVVQDSVMHGCVACDCVMRYRAAHNRVVRDCVVRNRAVHSGVAHGGAMRVGASPLVGNKTGMTHVPLVAASLMPRRNAAVGDAPLDDPPLDHAAQHDMTMDHAAHHDVAQHDAARHRKPPGSAAAVRRRGNHARPVSPRGRVLAGKRLGLVAEIIRHAGRRREVLGARGGLDGARRQAEEAEHGGKATGAKGAGQRASHALP